MVSLWIDSHSLFKLDLIDNLGERIEATVNNSFASIRSMVYFRVLPTYLKVALIGVFTAGINALLSFN